MRKLILIVMLATAIGSVAAQEREGSGVAADMLEEDWTVWQSLTVKQKAAYVWGVMCGAQAMASYIVYGQGYEQLETVTENFVPEYAVRDYIVAIDYVYERPEFRSEPYWALIFRIDYYIDERRKYD